MKKSFGEGTSKVSVRSDGKIEDSTGHVYPDYDSALAQAYDMEREQLTFLAKNLRDAVHYARGISTKVTRKLGVHPIGDDPYDLLNMHEWIDGGPVKSTPIPDHSATKGKTDLIIDHLRNNMNKATNSPIDPYGLW